MVTFLKLQCKIYLTQHSLQLKANYFGINGSNITSPTSHSSHAPRILLELENLQVLVGQILQET